MNSKGEAFHLSAWLFLRMLGICYFCGFFSLSQQITGLIGKAGILPVQATLLMWEHRCGSAAILLHPTLCWLNNSDQFLELLTVSGCVLAALIVFDVCTGPALLLAWAIYLSVVNVSGVFLTLQWDSFLLESGFLAIFLAPWQLSVRPALLSPNRYYVIWLLKWLLFRLMLGSGIVKLKGHAAWRNLTALSYYYETQPLPSSLAWYAHLLPDWFQHFSVALVLVIELIIPFFIFGPRKLRHTAAIIFALLQILINLTSNFGFWNFLILAVCISLFDDEFLKRFVPKALTKRLCSYEHISTATPAKRWLTALFVIFIVSATTLQSWRRCAGSAQLPSILRSASSLLCTYHIACGYGVFPNAHHHRWEVIIEGSNDMKEWRPYEFRYKPGDTRQPPPMVSPYHPYLVFRLEKDSIEQPGFYYIRRHQFWFQKFLSTLLIGSPGTIALLEKNPFSDHPPAYLRVSLYLYSYTTYSERQSTGDWWKRTLLSQYIRGQ